MAGQQLGVVAAGHPRTARAGADVLRDGGNAVDGALAAMAVSFACEPLLTGLGAGGYMLVVAPGGSQTLLGLLRHGVELNPEQAYVIEILSGIVTATPESRALFAPKGRVLRAGDQIRQPELGDALERLGAEGSAPFYNRDIGRAIVARLA